MEYMIFLSRKKKKDHQVEADLRGQSSNSNFISWINKRYCNKLCNIQFR